MNISEKYRLTNDELCIILEELKEIKARPNKDNPNEKIKNKFEWKSIGYFPSIQYALDYVVTKELIKSTEEEDYKNIIKTVEMLRKELPQISAKVFKNAKVFKKEDKPKKEKKKSILDEEIEYQNDFMEDYEE